MAAHRYWRLYVTAVDGSTEYASVGEFALFSESIGGTNLAVGKTATQSGNQVIGSAANAIDGDGGTEAGSSFPLPWWLAVDLGSGGAADIKRFEISAQRVVPNRSPKDFKIQWSDDGTTWTDQATFTGQTGWTQYESRSFATVSATYSGVTDLLGVTVRAHNRATGTPLAQTTSDAVTGAYSLTVGYDGECYIVALDDAGGITYNDKIARVMPA